ncbi:MAG: TIR domain-containing protein [Firmicutes bacterium]|nr:TIR domain-containing protein [Bacillota bacterium]
MKPLAYEGKEPYIFISYAHRDSERVFQVLEELDKKGYRIWYDDGIAPGSEWPEDIARHLDAAHMVIAFVTPNSMASQNCRREINFALSKEKRFLSILLEKTEMPLGMEMQLSAQQSILRYNYATWEAFIGKILTCPDIGPCQRPAPQPEPAAPEPQPVQQVPQQPQLAPQQTPAQPAPAQPAAVPVQQPPKAKPAKVKQPKEKKPAGKKKLILFGSIAAAVVIISVLAVVLLLNASFKTSWDEKISRSATYVTCINKTLTQQDLKNISQLKKLKTLTLNGCDLSSCDFSSISFSSTVYKIDFSDCSTINDFHFLQGLNLKELILTGQGGFSDLSLITLDELNRLSLNGTSIKDLSYLQNASKLTELYVSGTQITDISPLSGVTNLIKLEAAQTGVTDLTPIASLEKLTSLNVSGCVLQTIPEELMCLKLDTFHGASCSLKDLGFLKNCTKLKVLDISDNPLLTSFDIVIDQNHETLTTVQVDRTSLGEEEISTLSQCTLLKDLSVSGLQLKNLDFCRNLTELVSIHAEGCGLTDIAALSRCSKLKTIMLSFNQIRDVSSLASITPSSSDTVLDLSFNQLEDVSSLPIGSYRFLLLHGNTPSVIGSLTAEHKAYVISTEYYDAILTTSFTNKGAYYNICLTGTPTNQVLTLQETFGEAYLKLLTMDELMQTLLDDTLPYQMKQDYSYPYSLYENK